MSPLTKRTYTDNNAMAAFEGGTQGSREAVKSADITVYAGTSWRSR